VKRARRRLSVAVAASCIIIFAFAFVSAPQIAAQSSSSLPSGASVAKPHAYVSLDEVPAGHPFEVAIFVDILTGYHMNSHKPSEEYLIPTGVTLAPAPGFRETGTTYPDGQMLQFDFSREKLSVYSGSVSIRVNMAADADAAPGEATLPFTLRFQACNMSACLPPAKVAVPVKVKVVAANAKPHPAHPEIFKSQSK
jgi:thioredoxin:protein disulfide reductase